MNSAERAARLVEKREQISDRTERLWAKGQFRDFNVYRVPVELLRLNPTNRRFRAEREELERELGRPFDPDKRPKDERSVISLLLDDDPHLSGEQVVGREGKDARALREDWERRQQERPLWIRRDGFVSNGNRRLAMLKRLGNRHGTDAYDYVDVIELPQPEFDDDALFEMEAREQLTEGLKVRYSDLNLLLTLKDAAEQHQIDWSDPRSIDDVGRTIQHLVGNNVNYARVQLHAVRYMSEYLEYIERAGQYRLLNRMVERFRDVGKNMAWAHRYAASQAPDLLEVMFSAIQAGAKHGDLRDIRRLLEQDPPRFEGLVREVRGIEDAAPEPEPEPPPSLEGAQPPEDDDEDEGVVDDEEDAQAATGAPSRGYPVRAVKRAVDLAVRNARERENTDAHEHVRAAADALSRVDPEDLAELLAEPEGHRLRDAVDVITAWSDAAVEALECPGGDG